MLYSKDGCCCRPVAERKQRKKKTLGIYFSFEFLEEKTI